MTRPAQGLAARSARTLAVAFALFLAFAAAAVTHFVLLPLARRSAEDLAALMMLSVQTWAELPPGTRPAFEDELFERHRLWLDGQVTEPLPQHAHHVPYLYLLEDALARRSGRAIHLKATVWDEPWYWAEIPVGERELRIGFPESRLATEPLRAGLLVLAAALLASLATARLLARRITQPLAAFAVAAEQVGRGAPPPALPEAGPRELALLAAAFNRMAAQVRELLANRTTLLAGVSHDLRTPLARLRVALEMLPAHTEPKLRARMERDLEEMTRLIGSFLEVARGLGEEPAQDLSLAELVEAVGEDLGRPLPARGCERCLHAAPLALRRILANLVENALRYGQGSPVEIECAEAGDGLVIAVLDRGPGIPAEQREAVFQPFHRLEASRSKATGGSGLGLAIARQLAEAQGWHLTLHARAGGGLEARLRLA